jgi:probable HAF family extracellular repeat protein
VDWTYASNAGGSSFAPAYAVADLGSFAGSSYAQGINNAGAIVGYSYLDAFDSQPHAFLYTNGVMQDLGTFGGSTSWGFGINDSTQMVGGAYVTNGSSHAFRWTAGAMKDLGTLGGTWRTGYAINNLGHVAGRCDNSSGRAHAFLYITGMQDLGTLGGGYSYAYGINDSDQVVGWAELTLGGFQLAFRYSGTMVSLGTLGGNMSHAYGINNLGQVVGWANYTSSDNNVFHPFLYSGGMQDLGTLGGTNGQASGINNLTQVVGWSETATGARHAFVYSGGGMLDLNNLIPTNSGWTLVEATAINDKGQIVGYGANPSGKTRAFLLTPVPVILTATPLPAGVIGVPYNITLTATNGATPFSWSITSGGLPDGLSFAGGTGIISGTPGAYCTSNLVVRCTANDSAYAEKSFTLAINPIGWEAWQIRYFGCTNCVQASNSADPDGDGQSNLQEFLTGTDPTNSASAFCIISIKAEDAGVRITWKTGGGKTNVVQAGVGDYVNNSPSYSNMFWDLSGPIVISGGGETVTNFFDDNGPWWEDYTNWPAHFYRVRLSP